MGTAELVEESWGGGHADSPFLRTYDGLTTSLVCEVNTEAEKVMCQTSAALWQGEGCGNRKGARQALGAPFFFPPLCCSCGSEPVSVCSGEPAVACLHQRQTYRRGTREKEKTSADDWIYAQCAVTCFGEGKV